MHNYSKYVKVSETIGQYTEHTKKTFKNVYIIQPIYIMRHKQAIAGKGLRNPCLKGRLSILHQNNKQPELPTGRFGLPSTCHFKD